MTEPIHQHNLHELTEMALELWPDCLYEEEYAHFEQILASGKDTCFLYRDGETAAAFVCLSLRSDYVEGSENLPVAYVEAIYVKPPYRKKGLATLLIKEAEAWAVFMGCSQLASDAEADNTLSHIFHCKTGFKEVNRIVCFIKNI